MRIAVGWAIVGLLVAACGSGQASVAATADPTSAPTGAMSPSPSPVGGEASPRALMADVDIGGRSIHVECRGTAPPGVPTILLESGLEGSMANWSGGVRPALETRSKVCAYSRAGLGGSDPAPEATRTIEDMADDLEATLDAAGIAGPFLIAAHSMGPWISIVYTSRHPDQVVGLVLVDPRGPGVTRQWSDALGEPTPGESEAVTALRAFLNSGYEDNMEHLAFAQSEAIAGALLDADGPFFGDRLVTVLSADGTIDQILPQPDDLREALRAASVDGQRRYADESTRGTFTVVEGSGHMMTDDQPAAVIEAVEEMLEVLSREQE
jgi:pimeloyl-ACP methyl ester carboxylesterase